VEVSGDKTLRLSWVLPEFRALTPRSDVHFEGLELHWKLDDRTLGTGKTWFHVARAHLGGSRAEGVGIATHGELGAEQLKLQLTASAKKLDFNGLILERVFAQAATSGIAAAPARTLMTLARENCVEALSPADDAAWHAAQRSLSDGGGALTVSPLTAASSDGGLNGDLSVELSPAARAPGRLVSRVRARGQLKLDGASLSSRAKTQRGLGGYFLDDPSGVHASFSFEQRRLQVNDRPWNGLMYQLALTMFERTLGL
jgi:hypothetical protein